MSTGIKMVLASTTAEWLGVNRKTLHLWIYSGRIPAVLVRDLGAAKRRTLRTGLGGLLEWAKGGVTQSEAGSRTSGLISTDRG
jgi:hypothetical protein